MMSESGSGFGWGFGSFGPEFAEEGEGRLWPVLFILNTGLDLGLGGE